MNMPPTTRELITANDYRIRELIKDPEMNRKFIVIKTVPVERRLLQFTIDLVVIFLVSILLSNKYQMREVFLFVYFLYFLIGEGVIGTTLGKKIMRHVIVNSHHSTLGFGTVFIRSLSRLIPFDPLTCLGDNSHGWHDKISNTFVITEAEFNRINRKIEFEEKEVIE